MARTFMFIVWYISKQVNGGCMKNIFIGNSLIVGLLLIFSIPASAQKPLQATFTFYGQACFMITTSQGTRIVTDPMLLDGYPLPKDLTAEIVTVSHNHRDHNYVKAINGKPRILYGMEGKTDDASDHKFIAVDEKIKDVRIYNVLSNHFDSDLNTTRNAIFVFEFDGIKVVHLGDIGTLLSEEQLKKIGNADVLMIPVGGKYTVTLEDADFLVSQLQPKLVVFPMHFRTEAAKFLPATAEDFLKGKSNAERIKGRTYKLDLSSRLPAMKYVLLDYKDK
jgi:L-ascorbate metabolism protein UlaG (beta-lactamase superfamily)